MDVVSAMLDPKRSLASMQKRAVGGLVKGRIMHEEPEVESESDEEVPEQKDYAKEYQLAEQLRYQNAAQLPVLNDESSSMMDVDSFQDMNLKNEDDTDVDLDLEDAIDIQQRADDIYSRYKFDLNTNTTPLPITHTKSEILTILNAHNVIIIQGQTGCGKTTQVPQYILDQARDCKEYCNIAVTQPRKIAAISVSRRVCEERGWSLGTVCGFKVGLKRACNADTILTYMTSGVLLQKLVHSQSLSEFTHIILDEVHERDQDLDFLMLIVRKFLHLNSPKVKIILMSATFDTDKYANYFLTHSHSGRFPAPTIFVPKTFSYQIHIYYASQLTTFQWPEFYEDRPSIELPTYNALVNLVKLFSKLDVRDQVSRNVRIGSVLVFLPGIFEIEEAYRCLSQEMNRSGLKWELLPLHSSITQEQQQRVFNPPSDSHRKIILSTNIAESSITVPDIEYVVDFCLTKTMVVDPDTHFSTLKLNWASHVNCVQRAGRVGRVCDGRVYRLVPEHFYKHYMKPEIDPEILRAPLDKLVLSCKKLKLHDPPKAILALALDPPELKNIDSTILSLKEAGAMLVTTRGVEMTSDGDLTFLGTIMSSLPLDVRMSKLIVLGYIFCCLEECVIMAAGCSLSNIFSTPFQEKLKAYCNILPWADGSCSDLIALYNFYKIYQSRKRRHVYRNQKEEHNWAKQNYISPRSMVEWEALVAEINERLHFLGIREHGGTHSVRLHESEATLFLKIAICGAFYPNYFIRSCEAGQVDEEIALRTLNSHDPFRSVYFSNMDPALPGPLYAKSIRDLLADCSSNMEVFFYGAKVVVTFGGSPHINIVKRDGRELIATMSDRINTQVYVAVRKRQIQRQHIFYAASHTESWEVAELNGYYSDPSKNRISRKKVIKSVEGDVLPTLDIQFIYLKLSRMIDAGHFWVINTAEVANLEKIRRELNGVLPKLAKLTNHKNIVGNVYATLVANEFRRCRVYAVVPVKNHGAVAELLMIDTGEVRHDVPISDLYVIPMDKVSARWPGQAIECVLANLQPSLVMNSRSVWHLEANKYVEKTLSDECFGKIYSVLNNVVRVELLVGSGNKTSINQQLINRGYALLAEESFLSKERHNVRDKVQLYSEDDHICTLDVNGEAGGHPIELKLPGYLELRNKVALNGPFSPLEMQIFSILKKGQGKQARIEGTSVNSVLLDTDPQDPHERLLVAAYVGLHASNHSLTLRHTTLMPNIHGFPALMAMLFCRSMEPKPTEFGTHYAEILCGLGKTLLRKSRISSETERSMYSAHDVLLTLDTELTVDDVESVNVVRYWMNQSMEAMRANFNKQNTTNSIEVCQSRIKTHMMDVLRGKTPRKPLKRQHVKDSDKWGKFTYDGYSLRPFNGSANENDIWPLHCAIELQERNRRHAEVEEVKEEMLKFAKNEKPMTEYTCKFCNVKIESIQELRLHIVSTQHKTKINNYLVE